MARAQAAFPTGLAQRMIASNGTRLSRRSVWAFVVLACLLSWPVWLASGVLSRAGTGAYDARWLVAQLGVMGPSLAALLVSGWLSHDLRRNSLRLLPFVLGPLALPGMLVARASPVRVSQMPLLPAIATVVVTALVVLFLSSLNTRLLGPATGTPQARPPARVVLLSLTLFPALFLLSWAFVSAEDGHFEIAALQGGPLASVWMPARVLRSQPTARGFTGRRVRLARILATRAATREESLRGVAHARRRGRTVASPN